MRIAITGGTGFVGRNTARALIDAGHEVVLIARGSRDVVPREGLTVARANVVEGTRLVEAFAGCDVIVHLVAIIRERGRQTFDAVIRRGTENVLAAAREAGVNRLVYVSAIGAGPDPAFPYLFAKWEAEQAIRASGIPFTTLRPSLVFGPGDGFFTTVASLVRFSIPVVPVAGDGGALFQPISVGDLARCIVTCVERPAAMKEIEVGGPEQLSYDEIIDVVHDAIGAGMRIKVHVPVGALLPAAAVMDRVLSNPPVTPTQLRMLAKHNITRLDAVPTGFGFQPDSFRASAGYLAER